MSRSFRELFSFESYCAINAEDNPQVWRQLINGFLVPAFKTYFYELVDSGKITVVETGNREIEILDIWNMVILSTNRKFQNFNTITVKICHKELTSSSVQFSKNLKKGYDKFIDCVDRGEMKFASTENRDQVTGENFCFELVDWKPKLFGYESGSRERVYMKAIPPVEPINTVNVTFETGEVLVADWIREENFYNQTENKFSVNYDSGRINQTEHFAKLGVVHVTVGNASPMLFQNGTTLVVGNYKDADEESVYTPVINSITTDLWAVTMIDRAQLNRMIGKDQADIFISEEKPHIIKIEPGEYKVSYSPKYYNFHEHAKTENFDLTDIDTLVLMEKI